MAEVIEQKPIGIPIGIDGSFSNTEFKDGVLQIKESSLDPLEYHPMGLWTSKITDIGDNFKEYGKIIVTSNNKNGSRVEISTRSSADGVSFSVWQRTADDGSIISPKNKFIQVRLALYSGTTISNIGIANDEYTENNQFIESVIYQNGQYITPTLTSNTSSPLGFAFSTVNTSGNTYDAWKAFDKANTSHYQTAVNQHSTGAVGFIFNSNTFSISKYLVRSVSVLASLNITVSSWFLEGSVDTTNGTDGIWEELDSQANQTWTGINQDKVFTISKTKEYKAFRLRWIANSGNSSYTGIGELDFFMPALENIQLKRDYGFDMIQDSTWADTGSLHRHKITRNEWLKIDKLKVVDNT